jgi:hypothetical protein
MADHEVIRWAHRYALTADMGSLNHAVHFLKKGLRDDIDVYVLISPEPDYCPLFLDDIEQSLEALQLVARGMANASTD